MCTYILLYCTLWVLNFRPFSLYLLPFIEILIHLTVSWIMWSIRQECDHPNREKFQIMSTTYSLVPLWLLNFHPFSLYLVTVYRDTDPLNCFHGSCDPSNRNVIIQTDEKFQIMSTTHSLYPFGLLNFHPFSLYLLPFIEILINFLFAWITWSSDHPTGKKSQIMCTTYALLPFGY